MQQRILSHKPAPWVPDAQEGPAVRQAPFVRRLQLLPEICGLLMAVVLLFLSASVGAQSGPLAVVKVSRVDLGIVAKGQVVDHLFEVFNGGEAPLFLSDSRSSCGCTVLDFDQEIAPGESGFVRARIDTRTVNGPAETELSISTNDPAHADLVFVLEITVEPRIGVFPPRARWNTVESETEGVIGVTLFALDGVPFEITSIELNNSAVSAEFREATLQERVVRYAGSQWRVQLRLSDAAAIGSIEGYASVSTNHPAQGTVFIPVSGFVRPLILITPESGDLGRIVLAQEERRMRYQVRNFGTLPMSIERVEVVGIEGLRATTEQTTEGHVFNIRLHFDPTRVAAGAFSGKVVLHTNLPKRKEISIQVRGELVLESEEAAQDK